MPNEEKIWEAVQKTQEDVKEIKEALLGDGFGNPGYKSRIERLETNSRFMRGKITSFDIGIKIAAGLLGLIGTIFAIVKYVPEIGVLLNL
jgi:hypothetical protein